MNWKKALSVLLALATCATIALALDVNGELKNALLEKRAADPSGTGNVTARVYYNTTSNVMKMFNGTSWLQIADTSTAIVNPMDSAGDIIVGGAAGAATKLDSGTANYVLQANGAASPTWVNTLYMGDGTVSLPPYSNNGDADTGMWFPSANLVGIAVGGQDTFRVSTGDVSVSVASNNSVAGARVDLLRAEGTSLASPSVILANDEIAQIAGSGYSGAAGGYLSAADIVMLVDGTPDSGGDTTDMPGRIEFRTSPDGTSVPVTALTIKGSGQLQAVNGTNTVPTYSFAADDSTGMYLNGVGALGLGVSGVLRAQATAFGLEAISGTATNPSYAFTTDSDTGMYRNSANILAFATAGVNRVSISTTAVSIASGLDLSLLGGTVSQNGTGGDTPHDCAISSGSSSSNTFTISCAAGKIATGGGCNVNTADNFFGSYPNPTSGTPTGWTCSHTGGNSMSVYAICCDY